MYKVRIIQTQSSGLGSGLCPLASLILCPDCGVGFIWLSQLFPISICSHPLSPELPQLLVLILTHCLVHSQQDDYSLTGKTIQLVREWVITCSLSRQWTAIPGPPWKLYSWKLPQLTKPCSAMSRSSNKEEIGGKTQKENDSRRHLLPDYIHLCLKSSSNIFLLKCLWNIAVNF